MHGEPKDEHRWLDQLLGDWTYQADCFMGPDQPRQTFDGKESVRPLGGFWVIAEGEGEMPGGATGHAMMTLGYDPIGRRYVGNWVGSMMATMFVYEATLDPGGRILPLECDGPSFTDPAKTVRYRDQIEIVGPEERTLTASALGDDGAWHEFMTARYTRVR